LVSDPAPPDVIAFAELSKLVRHLGDELASYRKRALTAESRLKQIEEAAAQGGANPERSIELEHENVVLHERLAEARTRTEKLLARVRFLRQQHIT
jgi:hypothetical protein